jgi:hypothetical protein
VTLIGEHFVDEFVNALRADPKALRNIGVTAMNSIIRLLAKAAYMTLTVKQSLGTAFEYLLEIWKKRETQTNNIALAVVLAIRDLLSNNRVDGTKIVEHLAEVHSPNLPLSVHFEMLASVFSLVSPNNNLRNQKSEISTNTSIPQRYISASSDWIGKSLVLNSREIVEVYFNKIIRPFVCNPLIYHEKSRCLAQTVVLESLLNWYDISPAMDDCILQIFKLNFDSVIIHTGRDPTVQFLKEIPNLALNGICAIVKLHQKNRKSGNRQPSDISDISVVLNPYLKQYFMDANNPSSSLEKRFTAFLKIEGIVKIADFIIDESDFNKEEIGNWLEFISVMQSATQSVAKRLKVAI